MPAIHYRQLGNPFSNIFGTGEGTTTTSAVTAAATSTLSSINILTDPLGGLTSAVASILAPTTPSPSLVLPTTSSTSSIPTPTGTTTSPTVVVLPTTPPTTVDVTSTIPRAAQASATTSSPSPSVSATPTSHNFTVAAVVVGVLVGLFALALVVSFFLRRWNRNRSGANPRESINFGPEEFRRAGAGLGNERREKYTEQKVYNDSAYQVPATPAPAEAYQTNPRAYPSEYMYQQQPPPQVYSPHPHHAYPSAAQQVAFEYRGEPVQPSPAQAAVHMEAYPNPHPVTHEDDAYGGI